MPDGSTEYFYESVSDDELVYHGVPVEYKNYCNRPQVQADEKDCAFIMLLDEFGHVSALMHKHLRPEAQNNKICKELFEDLKTQGERPPNLSKIFKGVILDEYESDSIMSHCQMEYLQANKELAAKTGLSKGDTESIKAVFMQDLNQH